MSLQPASANMTGWKGATFQKRITVLTAGEGSPAKDLTGWNARVVFKDPQTDAPLLTLTSNPAAGIVMGGGAGTVDLTIDDAVIDGLAWTNARYGLWLIDTAGEPQLYLRGAFHIKTA